MWHYDEWVLALPFYMVHKRNSGRSQDSAEMVQLETGRHKRGEVPNQMNGHILFKAALRLL